MTDCLCTPAPPSLLRTCQSSNYPPDCQSQEYMVPHSVSYQVPPSLYHRKKDVQLYHLSLHLGSQDEMMGLDIIIHGQRTPSPHFLSNRILNIFLMLLYDGIFLTCIRLGRVCENKSSRRLSNLRPSSQHFYHSL